MTKDEQIEMLREATKNARKFGAMDALRGLVKIQSDVAHEYESHGTAAEFRAAERIVSETQQMLEAISASPRNA